MWEQQESRGRGNIAGATEAEVGADRSRRGGGKGRRGPLTPTSPRRYACTSCLGLCRSAKAVTRPSFPSPPQVRAAAEAANAQRFIAHLPLQYE